MNKMKEEKGYALLLVLFMIVIFTLLGMAVLSASLGGAIRSQTKQKDVQTLHLAEKALNESVAIIKAELDGEDDINVDLLEEKLNTEILPIVRNNNVSQSIGNANPVTTATVNPGNPPVIVVKVTANIDGVIRTLEQEISVNTFPDVLNYAAGSEGNLIINGAPYFMNGDLYAGNKLLIKNQAEYIYNSADGKNSTVNVGYPYLDGKAYVQSLDNFKYCDSREESVCTENAYKDINSTSDIGVTTIPTVLGTEKENVQFKPEEDFVQLNIDESFIDKVTEAIEGTANIRTEVKNKFNQGIPELIAYLSGDQNERYFDVQFPDKEDDDIPPFSDVVNTSDLQKSYIYNGNFNIGASGEYKQLIYDETVKNTRTEILDTHYYRSTWFIVNGDLNIENIASDPIEIRGNILVTGNLNITGNVSMDSTIFVLGSTSITDGSIVGLPSSFDSNQIKELVLLSKGEILITRVNSFKDIPDTGYNGDRVNGDITRLDAFFYTDSNAELYGVGSVFWIRGGFFAKGDLMINAVRGNTQEEIVNSETGEKEITFEDGSASTISNVRSRFVIDYNKDIFTNQNAGLPRVKGVNLKRGKKVLVK
ncbi:hypothetical protein [Paenibacillus hexagrammi]|uniref:Polymer-forming cytoskeletal protein n=1 Tax=Paenibacillus hexagrammi TaxID=2908839 RepID=A0ABY3SPW0_9BACL|nr:hypothetical protein [Paenibacillus sp. YPD9-1]UJF35981.1 hypothetical protein L0M14_13380 [Paenibacillus sp. YPD9-1]